VDLRPACVPFHVASIDGIAQSDIGIAGGTNVAHGRKARAKREPRILGADERFPWHGNAPDLGIRCSTDLR